MILAARFVGWPLIRREGSGRVAAGGLRPGHFEDIGDADILRSPHASHGLQRAGIDAEIVDHFPRDVEERHLAEYGAAVPGPALPEGDDPRPPAFHADARFF